MKHHLFPYSLMLLALLIVSSPVNAQHSKRDGYRQQLDQVFTQEGLEADIDHFYTALNAAHPDLYRYISQPEFDSLVEGIKRKGPLTLQAFYNELNQVAAYVGCGHLLLSYPKKLSPYFAKYAYYPPLHLEIHENTAVVMKNLVEKDRYLNTVVRSINGIPMDSLVSRMNGLLVRDGYNTAANYWMLEKGWFNEIFIRYWPDSTHYTYQLEVMTDSGLVMQAVTLPAFDYQTKKPPRPKRTRPKPELSLSFDNNTNTAILTLKTFDPVAISRGKQKFPKFMREAFWRIYQDNPDQVIIDLRGNEGGNSFYPEVLIGYLSDKPFRLYSDMEIRYRSQADGQKHVRVKGKRAYKRMEKQSTEGNNGNLSFRRFTDRYVAAFPYHYEGNVYVMVNGGTYSAASELACYLKEHMEAVVVGSETGGSCDQITAGLYGIAELPNTGITVHIPLVTFHKDITSPRTPGCGLKPDIPQHFRPTDSIPDPELERLLEIIDGQKVQP